MTDKRTALLKKYAPMTKAQLKAVVAQYAAHFPEWVTFVDGTAFVRRDGLIQQMIWFQKMSSAAYRPTHVINTTALPMPRMLHQVLDIKHEMVEYRWHERKFVDTLTAMEEQFRPDIRKPLDITKVLGLCEVEAASMPDTTNNMAMLAILHSWLGHNAIALEYCERIQHCPLPTLAHIPEWEEKMRDFGRNLAQAVEGRAAREFLEMSAASANVK